MNDKAFSLNKCLIVTDQGFYDKFTWNAAIETAAKWLETTDRNNTNDAEEIRKLKK